MISKDKDWKEEYEEIKNELIFDQVSRAIKNNPDNWRYELEKIGLIWVEEDTDYEETKEENNAKPKNQNQTELVAYFIGKSPFTKKLVKSFVDEIDKKHPNYPLFRKFFKSRNKNLLNLLLSGLSNFPANLTLLSGIDYYHENNNILSTVINIYIKACKENISRENLKEVIVSFVNSTHPQGYNAIEELKDIFKNNKEKLEILKEVSIMCSNYEQDILF